MQDDGSVISSPNSHARTSTSEGMQAVTPNRRATVMERSTDTHGRALQRLESPHASG
jgi:hypothetical protein